MSSTRHLAFVLLVTLASLAGCKQGEGEYCQVDTDCEDGLVCAPLTDTCERSAGPSVDAGPDDIDAAEPDAEPGIDAAPIDMMIDAEPDAEPDAGT